MAEPDQDGIKTLSENVDRLTDRFDQYAARQERLIKVALANGNKKKLAKIERLITEGDDSLEDGDENAARGNWSGKLDFLLSCLGYAVGLGNVWRFPYLCYSNGGGAFFIPYVIMLVFVGMPIFFMELSLGQFSSCGPSMSFRFAPIFSGLGIGMVIVSSLVCIYYNMIIAWALYYLGSSFTSKLPWSSCDQPWNVHRGDNVYCKDLLPVTNCSDTFIKYDNGTCYNGTQLTGLWNETAAKLVGIKRQSASEQYFNRHVLDMSSGIHDMGGLRWQLVLCLLGAWVIVFLCLIKGIKSSGKVVYFTAIFPYVVLIILFINGMTLDGMEDGVLYYITPEWHRLLEAKVWNDAAQQIFFSLSACWGGLITMSSYNRFHNNVLRDTLIVCLGNSLTSIFAGFVIFSYLGNMAYELGTTVDKVAASGSGLAFIVYPEAVLSLPISPLWSILFFLMLITLGLDTQFALLETVTTSLMDKFVTLRKYKLGVIFGCSVFFFVCGLSLCTNGGIYMHHLIDSYAGNWSVLFISFFECIAVAWIYGWNRFSKDIEIMIGSRPSLWWRINWQVISPAVVLFILFFSWIDYSPLKYGEYVYPLWGNALGWLMSLFVVIVIPCYAIYFLIKQRGPWLMRLKTGLKPVEDWGPALQKHRRLVNYVPGFKVSSYAGASIEEAPDFIPLDPTFYDIDLHRKPGKSAPNGSFNSDKERLAQMYDQVPSPPVVLSPSVTTESARASGVSFGSISTQPVSGGDPQRASQTLSSYNGSFEAGHNGTLTSSESSGGASYQELEDGAKSTPPPPPPGPPPPLYAYENPALEMKTEL